MISVAPIHKYADNVQNVLNVGNRATTTQRTDGESMTTITIAVAEVNVICRAANRQAIISVVDDVVLE